MPGKWDKYVVAQPDSSGTANRWAQYEVNPSAQSAQPAQPQANNQTISPSGQVINWGNIPVPLNRQLQNTIGQPLSVIRKAMTEMRGNPLTGTGDLIHGLISTAFSPFNAAALGYEQAGPVGQGVAKTLQTGAAVPQLYSDILGRTADAVTSVLPKKVQQWEPTPGSARAWRNVASDAAQLTSGEVVPKVIGAARDMLHNAAQGASKALETKAITPPFNAAKGLETFDRPVETARTGDYGPSRRGLAKLGKDLGQLNDQSQRISEQSAKRGTKIDFQAANEYLDNLAKEAQPASAYYDETMKAIEDAKERLNRVGDQYANGQVPINIANQLKSSFEKLARGKYDQELKPSQVQIDTYKGLANHLLGQIVDAEPRLRQIGLRQRNLIELEPILERKVSATEKRSPINWALPAKLGIAGTVGLMSHDPLLGIGTLVGEHFIDNPASLHRAAVVLDALSRRPDLMQRFQGQLPPLNAKPSSGGSSAQGNNGGGQPPAGPTAPAGGGGESSLLDSPMIQDFLRRELTKKGNMSAADADKLSGGALVDAYERAGLHVPAPDYAKPGTPFIKQPEDTRTVENLKRRARARGNVATAQ